MTARQGRRFVVLNLPESIPPLIKRAQSFVAAMAKSPFFPKPKPSLAVVRKAIAKLVAAETATATRARDTASKRNAALRDLVSLLQALQVYVQRIADANPEESAAIIAAAGMDERKPKSRRKRPFDVKRGPVSCSVVLRVIAARGRATYEWAWSEDDGKTWIEVEKTMRADTVITGLPYGKRCLFRYRVTTAKGTGDWSDPIEYVVD